MVNVYSKCTLACKRELWSRLVHLKRVFGGDVCCVMGDFNAVLSASERRGSTGGGTSAEMGEIMELNSFRLT